MKMHGAWLLLGGGLLSLSAQAHHIWIEQDSKQAKLYFGEFNLNLREASPGLLDKIIDPEVSLQSARGAQTLQPQKTPQALVIAGHAAAGESLIAQETQYPAYDKKVGDKTVRAVYLPAARYISDFTALPPKLKLDAVPTGKEGELKVYFQEQPLAKAKLTVIAASGWTRELRSDEQGLFTVTLPWKGLYAIEVHHTDDSPGVRGEDRYETASYVTTVTLVRKQGLASPPPPPAIAPSKP